METNASFIEAILRDYRLLLEDCEPFDNNETYMLFQEILLVFKYIHYNLQKQIFEVAYEKTGMRRDSVGKHITSDTSDKAALLTERDSIRRKIVELESQIQTKLRTRNEWTPRVLSLGQAYEMNDQEISALSFMVVLQGTRTSFVQNMISSARLQGLVYELCEMSTVDTEMFCDIDRPYMKEGVMTKISSYRHEGPTLQRTAVQILYGRKVRSEEMLKISQTALEKILHAEKSLTTDTEPPNKTLPPSENPVNRVPELNEEAIPAGLNSLLADLQLDPASGLSGRSTDQKDGDDRANSTPQEHDPMDVGLESQIAFKAEGSEQDDLDLLPFSSDPKVAQLDYLEKWFQIVALMVKGTSARTQQDLQQEGALEDWQVRRSIRDGPRELEMKQRLAERVLEKRLEATRRAGISPPRLESLALRLGLDDFEKKVILVLVGKTISPIVKGLIEKGSRELGRGEANVGSLMAILCTNFHEQVEKRKYFYRSGKLVAAGIITLNAVGWRVGGEDLTEQGVQLHRRVLDFVVGLDSEVDELVQGSKLYEPLVSLRQVILPPNHLDHVLKQCRAYESFRLYRKSTSLKHVLSYGCNLVFLLCGASGTGKTMTVNGIAKELGKKVLSVDSQSLSAQSSGGSGGGGTGRADLLGLLREAQLNNAVIFFDECETIFRNRGDVLNSLLMEIEKHEGIIFLATNKPGDLDVAMHRRITAVVEYRAPDAEMRFAIWASFLGIGSSGVSSGNKSGSINGSTSGSTSTASNVLGRAAGGIEGTSGEIIAKKSEAAGATAAGGAGADGGGAGSGGGGGGGGGAGVGVGAGAEHSGQSLTSELDVGAGQLTTSGLRFSGDIDIAAIATKYEMTGGFIKNAVLAALLSALTRDPQTPVITQADLLEGCKLQMRGNLLLWEASDTRIVPTLGLADLELDEGLSKAGESIVATERAKDKVFGVWSRSAAAAHLAPVSTTSASPSSSSTGSALDLSKSVDASKIRAEVSNSGGSSSCSTSSSRAKKSHLSQQATIVALGGPTGSGKKTFASALAHDLGMSVRREHVGNLMDQRGSDRQPIHTVLAGIVLDTRLSDSVLVLDGFEHVFAKGGGGGSGGAVDSLELTLARILDTLYSFPGLVLLVCHIDAPRSLRLQHDFASKLFSFLRFPAPSRAVRTRLWQRFLPTGAPTAADIKFDKLGSHYELGVSAIRCAVVRAASVAAMRPPGDDVITMKDLERAGSAEQAKFKGEDYEIIALAYI